MTKEEYLAAQKELRHILYQIAESLYEPIKVRCSKETTNSLEIQRVKNDGG